MIFKETKYEIVYDYSNDIIENVWVLRNRESDSSHQIIETEGDGVWTTGNQGRFRNILVSAIGRARDVVCVSSFLISDTEIERALRDAAIRGVRVYILSAPDVLLDQEEAITDEEEGFNKRIEEYKAFLNRIAGKMLLRAASHFHSKFLLIDPKNPRNMEGYLSTANFTKALIDRVEIGVRLTPSEIQGVYQQFVRGFWIEAAQELRRKERLISVSIPPENLEIPSEIEGVLTTISSQNSAIQTLQEGIIEFLEQTEGPVYISMYGFDEGHTLIREITKQAIKREIIVLTRLRPNPRQIHALYELADAGIVVFGHEHLHAKAMVSKMNGEPVALVMTANFQSRGIDEGFETGILLREERAQRVKEILKQWIENFPWTFKAKAKLCELLGPIRLVNGNNFTERIVEKDKSTDGGSISVKSLDIDPIKTIPKERQRPKDEFYHKVKVIYHLRPPLVPAGAERIRNEKAPLPIYKSQKKTFIAVKNEKELQTAIWLKDQRYSNALIVVEGK